MVGRTGTGKTHLACAIARNVLDKRSYVRYVTSEDMANEIATAWTKPDDNEANAIFRFTDCDLLILMNMVCTTNTRVDCSSFIKFYMHVMTKKPTVLISNMTLESTEKAQGLKENLGTVYGLGFNMTV